MNNQASPTDILVIDDDIDFLDQQKLQLEAAGYAVRTAESMSQAAEQLDEKLPDLAICDLMMENLDAGFTLCYQIKKLDPSVPVILCTAVGSETSLDFDAATDEERSWVKADAMLAKPIRFEQLQREIARLLKEA